MILEKGIRDTDRRRRSPVEGSMGGESSPAKCLKLRSSEMEFPEF